MATPNNPCSASQSIANSPISIACTDCRLLRSEKALLPVTVISDPGNGTQKFLLLRAGPTGRERRDEGRRHARD